MPISLTEIFRSGRTLSQVLFLALSAGLYSCLPMWKEHSPWKDIADTPSQIHAALSLILGWLLVFRTNTAYARWWEARTLWGSLVNASRNFALKCSRLVRLENDDLERVKNLLSDFAIALKMHLREEPASAEILRHNRIEGDWDHHPLAISAELYRMLGKWKESGKIDGDELRVLDAEAARFMDICGACERIQRTRIVRSYRIFARQCVLIFLFTFPWGIAEDFGWWTMPLTAITAYFMLGLEVVAEHVEEPFGYDDDDLDLDALCRTISSSVADLIPNR
ncbi:MAG: bestrophin family ion channel [Pirellulales bacterium]